MNRKGGLSAGLGTVDLDYTSLRITSDTESVVKSDRTTRNDLARIPFWLISQLHDCPFAVVFLDLVDSGLQRR